MSVSTGRTLRVSGADAAHLTLDRADGPDTIGLLGVLDAGPLLTSTGEVDIDHLRNMLASRVESVPVLNRRLAPPGDQATPTWEPCAPNLADHVRSGPAVVDDADLARSGARSLEEPLPRDRPLWDLTIMPGPGPGRATLVLRLHHAIADGVSAAGIVGTLFDPTETPAAGASGGPSATPSATPSDTPSATRSATPPVAPSARGAAQRSRNPAVDHGPSPPRWARRAAAVAGLVARPLPHTSLLGPRGRERTVRLIDADLADVRAVAHGAGATVNDVVLDAVTVGTAALLRSRGEVVMRELPVSVPVALPRASADSPTPEEDAANRVGVMVVRLPLREGDTRRRLTAIAAVTHREAARSRASGTLPLMRGHVGAHAMDVLSRHQRLVGMFVTNVRGPGVRMSLAGAEMIAAWPLTVIAGNVRIAVAAMTYGDRLSVTVVADAASTPDIDVFAAALRAQLSTSWRSGLRPPRP